jgi:hypothetical protein
MEIVTNAQINLFNLIVRMLSITNFIEIRKSGYAIASVTMAFAPFIPIR